MDLCMCRRLLLVLVLGCIGLNWAGALQCYTTPDFPCEVDKGYTGGCIEDVGVLITCSEPDAKCKTIMRNSRPAYYFVNKSCDPNCQEAYSEGEVKNSKGMAVRETVECCSSEKCNERNLPREAATGDARTPLSHALLTRPYELYVLSIGVCLLQIAPFHLSNELA